MLRYEEEATNTEVDLYTMGNHSIQSGVLSNQVNTSYFEDIGSSYDESANENKACYMSKTRISLAKKLTSEFYNEILILGGWHSDFIQKMQTED